MKGWIYFLQCGDDGSIKIGRSSRPIQRVRELNTASPVELELLGVMQSDDMESEERALHERLGAFRIKREWFEREAVLAEMKLLGERVGKEVDQVLLDEGEDLLAKRFEMRCSFSDFEAWETEAKRRGLPSVASYLRIVMNEATKEEALDCEESV